MANTADGVIAGHCDGRFGAVADVLEAALSSGAELGVAVTIIRNGEVVVDLHGGFADAARTRSWQHDTLVNVFSVTKPMTALAALRLVDQGVLALDDPVAAVWPEFGANGKSAVTLRHLLTHSAGVPGFEASLAASDLYDWAKCTTLLAAQAPWWEPGTQHGYHSLTYGYLVGEVVRRASGRSLGRVFREQIADPGEIDFHIGVDPANGRSFAEIIEGEKRTPPAPPSTMTRRVLDNPRGPYDVNSPAWRAAEIPAGNGHATSRAVAEIFDRLIHQGSHPTILSADLIHEATTASREGPDLVLGRPLRSGLGVMLNSESFPIGPNPGAFGHPGVGGAMGFADPDAGLSFAYVMNRLRGSLIGNDTVWALVEAMYASA